MKDPIETMMVIIPGKFYAIMHAKKRVQKVRLGGVFWLVSGSFWGLKRVFSARGRDGIVQFLTI